MSASRKVKLIRISPKTLLVGDKYEYTIYQHQEGDVYKKFLPLKKEYNYEAFKYIEKNNINNLYVTHQDFKKYIKKGSEYLCEYIKSDDINLLVKSEFMYQLSCEMMYDLLSETITKEKIDELSKNIDVAIQLIYAEPEGIKTLIQVTTHDYETHTHSVDVATYALGFGHYLGLNKDQLKQLTLGAILHDLGKKNIPSEIVNKKGIYSDQEFRIMKNHPSYGVDTLRKIGIEDESILAIVEEHHEKVDGSGYPRGLTGDKIHIFAQIVSICDIFNALTTRRSYKEQKASFEALKLMHSKMKYELNPKLFSKFIAFMGER
ncbi:MAG: HD domain-containing protein [Sphaerochaetaceae bacterium]|nr:HD domain-containing protein [Sphaerochaetaceae bacterium]